MQNLKPNDEGKMIVLSFSKPITINIVEQFKIFGRILEYKSHLEESSVTRKTCFSFEGQIFFQDESEGLQFDEFGTHWNVKTISLFIREKEDIRKVPKCESNEIYDKKVLLHLQKRYLSVIDEELEKERLEKQRAYEKKRAANEERKEYKAKLQSAEKRKDYEKKRAADEERKEYKAKLQSGEKRKDYEKKRAADEDRNMKKKEYDMSEPRKSKKRLMMQ